MFIRLSGGSVVTGRENLIWGRRCIIAANHISDCDPLFLGTAHYPLCSWWMAKEELFHIPLLGSLCATLHAFPIVRGTPDRVAIRFAESRLQNEEALTIFPEGRVNWAPERMRPFAEGVALLALRTGAPLIPAALVGTDRVWPYARFFPRYSSRPARVGFGRPLTFEALAGSRREKVAYILCELRSSVESLRQELLEADARAA
jgi:1-acyl-sn-glycerol-3-phosphate acyltransferase